METLQEAFERELNQLLQPEKMLAELINKKIRDWGIELTEDQLDSLKSQINLLGNDVLTLEFEDNQLSKAGFKDEKQFQKIFETLFEDLDADADKFINDLNEKIPTMIIESTKNISEIMLEKLKKEAKEMLNYRCQEISSFERRLYEDWGNAFDLLEMLIILSLEAGQTFNKEFSPIAAKNNDYVFEVLRNLHARACQIVSEILTLLKSGYADGALARWRTLHEIIVVGLFIASNGNDLAERYLWHDVIESFKATKIYQEHCQKLDYEPLSENEFKKVEANKEKVLNRFGKNFNNDYGWASKIIGKNNPTFREIEKTVDLEFLRPYYKMACHNIHANARGIFFKLGLYPESGDILLAGPSNVGLADPGYLSAKAISQISASLLTHDPSLDRFVVCHTLLKLAEGAGEAFFNAEQAVRERGLETIESKSNEKEK